MIIIDAALDEEGLLVFCSAEGHARAGPKGSDVVCASVSVLMRTAFRIFLNREGIKFRGKAPERGVFWLETDCTAEGREFLAAAGTFLLEGLRSIAQEYPDYCFMTTHTERRK
ncbi:MAG: ribosomal-processing cysteine protease Prp [Treponema sp.]|jgi:uncharacterized protein YsxB (DUF464 family)|nr:ribosomal-processing cysteine protease Prp [Treponema sp.]